LVVEGENLLGKVFGVRLSDRAPVHLVKGFPEAIEMIVHLLGRQVLDGD